MHAHKNDTQVLPGYGVKEFVCLSVCYKLWPQLFDLSSNQNQNTFEKKFASLAARAVFVTSFMLQKQLIYILKPRLTCFTQSVRKQTSWDSQDWRVNIFDFLAVNNNPNLPHSQGVWYFPHKFHLYLIYSSVRGLLIPLFISFFPFIGFPRLWTTLLGLLDIPQPQCHLCHGKIPKLEWGC